jgi:hypothetical protein
VTHGNVLEGFPNAAVAIRHPFVLFLGGLASISDQNLDGFTGLGPFDSGRCGSESLMSSEYQYESQRRCL